MQLRDVEVNSKKPPARPREAVRRAGLPHHLGEAPLPSTV